MKKIIPVIFLFLVTGFSCKREKEVTHQVKLMMEESSAYHPQYLICYGVSSNGVTACYNDTVNAYQYEEAAAKTGFKVRMELTCNDPHHDFTLNISWMEIPCNHSTCTPPAQAVRCMMS